MLAAISADRQALPCRTSRSYVTRSRDAVSADRLTPPWPVIAQPTTTTAAAAVPSTLAGAEALKSWNDGDTKRAILDFVTRVTLTGGPDFVPVPERIATFDNDGTL
jgi:hypothetical protein